jgi:hypothetical protein
MKVTKNYIKQLVKEELEAVMDEGYAPKAKGYRYGNQPRHPSDKRETPDFSKPSIQMAMSIADILRDNTILGISQSGIAAKKIATEFHGKVLDQESLKDFLMKNTFLQEDESAIAAEEIVKQIG